MTGPVAITRAVSHALADCELTHVARVPIDVDLARAQHAEYERALEDAGFRVERLQADAQMADSVFVEDIAVVLDELAVITRPGAESRRSETPAVADAVGRYRRLERIEAPGTLDGGDVLVVGRQVFVGLSTRTSRDAIEQITGMLDPFGYDVLAVAVSGCLHLKSAVTAVGERAVLINPDWIDAFLFDDFDIVEIDPGEPSAANVLWLGDRVIVPAACPRTADRLARRGLHVHTVDVSELAKAEGAVTCCSLLVDRHLATGKR